MYLMIGTRPDICFAIGLLSRFTSNPKKAHWEALERVARYCLGTRDYGLKFDGNSRLGLQGFSDAEFAGDTVDRKSTSGFIVCYNGCAIMWKSKKQSSVALSSCESEYVGLANCARELIWLKNMATELGVDTTVTLYGDNLNALGIGRGEATQVRTRHIAVSYHFVRDAYKQGLLALEYLQGSRLVADALTKQEAIPKFIELRDMMVSKRRVALE
jgi:hypothetical protein